MPEHFKLRVYEGLFIIIVKKEWSKDQFPFSGKKKKKKNEQDHLGGSVG